MYEFISILFVILGGFGGVFIFLYQILQEVQKNSEKINENSTKTVELRSDVVKEFALCRMHNKCGGMLTADKST